MKKINYRNYERYLARLNGIQDNTNQKRRHDVIQYIIDNKKIISKVE